MKKRIKNAFYNTVLIFFIAHAVSNVQIRIKDSLWLVIELFVISLFLMLFSI